MGPVGFVFLYPLPCLAQLLSSLSLAVCLQFCPVSTGTRPCGFTHSFFFSRGLARLSLLSAIDVIGPSKTLTGAIEVGLLDVPHCSGSIPSLETVKCIRLKSVRVFSQTHLNIL